MLPAAAGDGIAPAAPAFITAKPSASAAAGGDAAPASLLRAMGTSWK
jgi:hypothetical protein